MLFRNDDISADTDLNRFKEFCKVFDDYGLCQAHGVVINGYTNSNYESGKLSNGAAIAVPYAGLKDIAEMTHEEIVELSEGKHISQHTELVDFLSKRYWDEKVMHGLYHYDYSDESVLHKDIAAMRGYFSEEGWRKPYDKFVFPFNKGNASAGSLFDHPFVSYAGDGTHLESLLGEAFINPCEQYRYHHHRFYHESVFDHYTLSLEGLRSCFSRSINPDEVKIPGLSSADLEACLSKHGVQPWFMYNFEHCYTPIKEMLSLLGNIRPSDKNTFLVHEFGAGVGLNLLRLRHLGFKNMIGSDSDTKALRAAEDLTDASTTMVESDFTEFGPDSSTVKYDIALCLNSAMLDARFSYAKFFGGMDNAANSGALLLLDSVDSDSETRAEYKTCIKPEELIDLAAVHGWYPVFFKRDSGIQVFRDFFIFKKL